MPTPTLNNGWPGRLVSPLAWDGNAVRSEKDYTYCFNDVEIEEIDNALQYFKGTHLH